MSEARGGIGRYLTFYNSLRPRSSLDRQTPDQALLQRPDTDDGGRIIEAEIHLAKRPKLSRQTEPPLSQYHSNVLHVSKSLLLPSRHSPHTSQSGSRMSKNGACEGRSFIRQKTVRNLPESLSGKCVKTKSWSTPDDFAFHQTCSRYGRVTVVTSKGLRTPSNC